MRADRRATSTSYRAHRPWHPRSGHAQPRLLLLKHLPRQTGAGAPTGRALDRVALGGRSDPRVLLLLVGAVEVTLDRDVVPRVEDRDLVEALGGRAELQELGPRPVAVPVDLVLEGRHLQDLVAVVAVAVHRVAGGAVA